MDLYLIRHADAFALGERGVSEDSERALTPTGEMQAAAVGKMFQRRGIVLAKVVTSPYVRAKQTAEILLRHLKPAPEIAACEDLEPDSKPRKLAKFLGTLKGERIALVGHMPHIAEWAGWLIGSRKAQLDFAKAGVACIRCGEAPAKGLGTLIWLVTPEWFES